MEVAELLGDPKRFARLQFGIAQARCDSCRDYHALWPYRRLSGIANGFEADAELLAEHLRRVLPERGRLLIAGAADAGLLALALSATEALAPNVSVADRCATPLAVCSAFAESRGVAVATLQEDLPSFDHTSDYDVIFAHSILQFMDEAHRVPFLRRLRNALTERGRLVFAERLRPPGRDEQRHGSYVDDTVNGLAAAGIPLPEEEGAFRRRLEADVESRRSRLSQALGAEDLGHYLEAAGLRLRSLEDHALRRRMTAESGGRPDIVIQIAVASPG
jgi:SAM-dependent methyltransferase